VACHPCRDAICRVSTNRTISPEILFRGDFAVGDAAFFFEGDMKLVAGDRIEEEKSNAV
jgi:hypothetical protein